MDAGPFQGERKIFSHGTAMAAQLCILLNLVNFQRADFMLCESYINNAVIKKSDERGELQEKGAEERLLHQVHLTDTGILPQSRQLPSHEASSRQQQLRGQPICQEAYVTLLTLSFLVPLTWLHTGSRYGDTWAPKTNGAHEFSRNPWMPQKSWFF